MEEIGADDRYRPEKKEGKKIAPSFVPVSPLSKRVKDRRQDAGRARANKYHRRCLGDMGDGIEYQREPCDNTNNREGSNSTLHLLRRYFSALHRACGTLPMSGGIGTLLKITQVIGQVGQYLNSYSQQEGEDKGSEADVPIMKSQPASQDDGGHGQEKCP